MIVQLNKTDSTNGYTRVIKSFISLRQCLCFMEEYFSDARLVYTMNCKIQIVDQTTASLETSFRKEQVPEFLIKIHHNDWLKQTLVKRVDNKDEEVFSLSINFIDYNVAYDALNRAEEHLNQQGDIINDLSVSKPPYIDELRAILQTPLQQASDCIEKTSIKNN